MHISKEKKSSTGVYYKRLVQQHNLFVWLIADADSFWEKNWLVADKTEEHDENRVLN
jgi:hypothetical protein